MSARKTVITGVLFALALAVVWFDARVTERREQARFEAERLVPADSEEIARVTINRAGKELEIRRVEGEWRITQPIEAAVDRQAITDLLYYLEQQQVTDLTEASEAQLEEFGLALPPMTVEVDAEGLEAPVEFAVGEDAPVIGEAYARPAEQQAFFTISQDLKKQLRRSLYDYRDKSLTTFVPAEATTVTLSHEGRTVLIAQDEDDAWRLMQPIEDRADEEAVREILNELHLTQAADFIDTSTLELERYGLDAPQIVALLEAPPAEEDEEERRSAVLIGRRRLGERPTYYAMTRGRDVVYTVPQELIERLRTGPLDLRAKDIFTIAAEDVGTFAIEFGGQRIELQRDSGGRWTFGEQPQTSVDQQYVNELLAKALQVRVGRYLGLEPDAETSGMRNPRVKVEITDQAGERTEGFLTGRPAETEALADLVYARRLEDPEVFTVPIDVPGDFFVTREKFLDKTLFAFSPRLVEQIRVHAEGLLISFRRDENFWRASLEGTDQEFQVGNNVVEAFLLNLLGLKWKDRLDPSIERDMTRIKTQRLEEPPLRIELLGEEGQPIAEFGQGVAVDASQDDREIYVTRVVPEEDAEYYAVDKIVYAPFILALRTLLNP